MLESVEVGICRIGHNAGKPFSIAHSELVRHVLAVGGTGSGKTVALKRIAECLLAQGIPVVAVDVLGDISGLAVSARRARELLQIAVPTPQHQASTTPPDLEQLLEQRVSARILTPCSDMCERMALTPVPQKPHNYHELLAHDRDYLVLWADSGAAAFLDRVGMVNAKPQSGPDMVRGIVTDCILAAWERNIPLSGLEGLKEFGAFLSQWGNPPLPEKALQKIMMGISGLSVGAEALWHQGTLLDFERLLTPEEPGKTPLVVINIAHLPRSQHPWVVAQVLHGVWSWASAKGSSGGKPRVGVFLDELAGERGHLAILPPANYRSLSGEAIRRILRQGRHFGVTLLAGTQSPSDVDSNSFINFSNRLVGKIVGEDKAKIALQGANIQNAKRDLLFRLLSQAQQGQVFALTANGGFEAIQVHWLTTLHSKLSAEHYRLLYQHHILRRSAAAPRAPLNIRQRLTALAHDLKEGLREQDFAALLQIAQRY
ncbi:MAG: DUF853 family protein [Rectinema sp.]|nr:DUF853 family protein [Rectinema sp.]